MKKILLVLVLLLSRVLTSEAATAFIDGNHQTGGGFGVTSFTVALTGVTAGNLVVGGCYWVNTTGTTLTVADGGSTFVSNAAENNDGSNHWIGRMWYTLSAVTTGNVTYTCTPSAAVDFPVAYAMAFSYSGTAALDTSSYTGHATSGTTATTGAITTTGTDEVVVVMVADDVDTSSEVFDSIAAAQTERQSGYGVLFERLLSATVTSKTGVATLSGDSKWFASVQAFKITASGGSYKPQSLTTLGAGGE